MPSWLGDALNTAALATIVAFVLWGIVKIFRFGAPLIKDIASDIRAFFAVHIKLGGTLEQNSIQQTSLMERTVGMQHAQGETLSSVHAHGYVISEQLRHIADAVGAKRVAELVPHPSTVTFTPAVERSANGTDRPVLVKQEVIHTDESPEQQK